MDLQQDFKDVLACFNRSGVEYLIVGGYAVAFHGAPRYTGGLDVYVNPRRENARRIMSASANSTFTKRTFAPRGESSSSVFLP